MFDHSDRTREPDTPSMSTSRVEPALTWQDPASALSIWRIGAPTDGAYSLRLGSQLAVDVYSGGRVVIRPQTGVPQITIDHFLADQVSPRLLAHGGSLVIHAGAVRVGKQAVLFMGQSGQGKSTLTASFDQAGNALLGDDAMIISDLPGGPSVRAVYPSLRLLPDSIEALLPGIITAGPVAHYSTKERIDVARNHKACVALLPIDAIFMLGNPSDDISIQPLSKARGCMGVVASSFALDPSDVVQARARLDAASDLAAQVPMFELAYPRDYARLPEVRQAILDKVASLEPA